MKYQPKVNDYVKWTDSLGKVVEGWVYFVDKDYITIEVGVKEKPDDLVHFHKKTHCCVLCYPQYWHELEYVKSRKDDVSSELSETEEERVLVSVGNLYAD